MRASHKYDAAGRTTEIVKGFDLRLHRGCPKPQPPAGDPGLQTVSAWNYGSDGFLKSFVQDGVTYTVKVDGFGRTIEMTNPVGVIRRKGYDRLDRVVWEATYQAVSTPICNKTRIARVP